MRQQFPTQRLCAALAIALAVSASLSADDRQLVNGWDVRSEIKLAPGVDPVAVKNYFPSFYDYLDTVLFHPSAGYYSSGRVKFAEDYQTFPIALAPSFGHMIAEQMFRMWDGMRKAGTLAPPEKFTIAEFGAGNGALAESILTYIDEQAANNADPRWKEFKSQAVYACYDRSPALSEMQRKRNERFGARFEARQGDATNPGATIPPGSLKGVVLSNELPDCFSVYKVIVGGNGSVEIAYTVPLITKQVWTTFEPSIPAATRQLVAKDDEEINSKLLGKKVTGALSARDRIYLSRESFNTVLEALSKKLPEPEYEDKVSTLQFQEVYVPVSVVPELAEHFRQYAHDYAYELAKTGMGMVMYVNLGEGKFIRGAGEALKAGYVITIDYGSGWEEILSQQFDHLRMYGPGSSTSQANPYHAPTLNDMTTDVNFGHVAAEGRAVGLEALYFGPQHAIQLGTTIDLDNPPSARVQNDDDLAEFQHWAGLFYSWEVYKVLIQQKNKTDETYRYPQDYAEPLAVADNGLSEGQRAKMTEIEKKLGR
ncbi:MAG TPA: SAM-dependent methyltransferase [Verrucomicrobiae bacterium]|nr:SAM-dependent methyltransferase [Verrucomicrobiae bacterium]